MNYCWWDRCLQVVVADRVSGCDCQQSEGYNPSDELASAIDRASRDFPYAWQSAHTQAAMAQHKMGVEMNIEQWEQLEETIRI